MIKNKNNRKPTKNLTSKEIEQIPEDLTMFNCRCVLPEDLETDTISETDTSLVYLMILQFCKN